ncbi:helix-turn-helix domain-containing protein [Spirosoma sp. HMF3257]|uniref:AraC family transcriptional regulator n=1 Tax=Spirosoma telluris TaxID=2183553 RepID=A0A327NQI4_9BACT|nr:helix-turn-helix domain-containing protein [Spirosoma telluris]RAI76985.1 AraC family transcriptional regulator [Spirosoma telluris]
MVVQSDSQQRFEKMVAMAERLGIQLSNDVHADFLQSIEFNSVQIFDYLPDFALMIRSMISKKEFTFNRGAITAIEQGILIAFNNYFDDGFEETGLQKTVLIEEIPSIQIVPLHSGSSIQLPKHAHQKQIFIMVSIDYLQSLLKEELSRFDFLFGRANQFFIEEFMSADILRIANEISKSGIQPALPAFYYKLKTVELLYFLFRDLRKRKETAHQNLSAGELKAIYKVRDALLVRLNEPIPVKDLVRIAGMNELKLRKLFIQIFGLGLYAYFQRIRMQEAARLLREENLTVSETGYRLGFTNLSHFTRLFEQHMGSKPKKWSMEKGLG